ncbi:piggyBac transposable element-derived protein 4-like isoform X4 [Ornithodoros turicata]|uniref:piggyBac transposable element-derived protein 4-like isoform X4 n=1 Tax=Ornithodoros turicata TaxID=34597 RepID=UPI00313A0571
MAASGSIAIKVEPEDTSSSIFPGNHDGLEEFITDDYPSNTLFQSESTLVKEEAQDTMVSPLRGNQANGDEFINDDNQGHSGSNTARGATTVRSAVTYIKEEPHDARHFPSHGTSGNAEVVAETVMVPSDFFCVKEEPSSPLPGNDEDIDELLMSDQTEAEISSSGFISIKEEPQCSSSSVPPDTWIHESIEDLITDNRPGHREQMTSEEVWELSFSFPDDPNDSADEYSHSSEEELLELDPDECSDDKNELQMSWSVPSTSGGKLLKQYPGKTNVQIESRESQLGPRDDAATNQWDTSVFAAPAPNSHGPTYSQQLNEGSMALDAFTLYFDNHVMQHIVDQTNHYALQKHRKGWRPLAGDELRAYIGLLILMSINPMHEFQMYWSSDSFFHVKEITQVMTYKRFLMITNCLHLNENAKTPQHGRKGFDCFYKVRPFIDMMNERFQAEYSPSSHVAIDESMVLFKGRSRVKRKIKHGYKVWSLADSETGYLLKFEPCEGKSARKPLDRSFGEHVILALADSAVPAGSQLFLGNLFASTHLLQELRDRDVLACGMFCASENNLPPLVQVGNNVEPDSYLWRRKGDVVTYQWKELKNVHVMSNYHDPECRVQVQRTLPNGKKKAVDCPAVLRDYSIWMSGVRKFDQRRNAYATDHCSKRWWSWIFYFILDAAVVNAYIQINSLKPVAYFHFRLNLGRQLIGRKSFRKPRISLVAHKKKRGDNDERTMTGVPETLRFAGNAHHPSLTEARRRCRWCSTKAKESRTKYMCSVCEVPLCVVCFGPFHSQ